MGVCNAQLYGTIHGKTKDTFSGHPLIKHVATTDPTTVLSITQHLSYYCHDVSIGVWEAGKEGEKKKVLITVFHAWE